MDTASVLQDLGVYGGAFLVCLVSGLVPLVNAELFLIGVVALTSPGHAAIAIIVLLATIGQMVAKAAMYWGARGVLNLPLDRYAAKVEAWRGRFARSEPGLSVFIFTSALTGLPPFFITSILAGIFKIPFVRFVIVGSLGRYVRFGVAAWAPVVIAGWWL